MQVEKKLEGRLTACRCGKQPMHVHTRGRELHHLECPPCQVRTQKFESLQLAVEAWERQEDLALMSPAQLEARR